MLKSCVSIWQNCKHKDLVNPILKFTTAQEIWIILRMTMAMAHMKSCLRLFGALRGAAEVVDTSLGPLRHGQGSMMRKRGSDGDF